MFEKYNVCVCVVETFATVILYLRGADSDVESVLEYHSVCVCGGGMRATISASRFPFSVDRDRYGTFLSARFHTRMHHANPTKNQPTKI